MAGVNPQVAFPTLPREQLAQLGPYGTEQVTRQGELLLTGPELPRARDRAHGWVLGAREPHVLETSLPGVFAAGDVRSGSTKRVATAVGEGAVAVLLARQYLVNAVREHRSPEARLA